MLVSFRGCAVEGEPQHRSGGIIAPPPRQNREAVPQGALSPDEGSRHSGCIVTDGEEPSARLAPYPQGETGTPVASSRAWLAAMLGALQVTPHRLSGASVIPREWFLVPLFAIEEAVERIKDEP
ncbi:hypothetical protein GCM10011504_27560 [Siccirubricoccus deserti]|nr:hypothetical protein GCM10011504_27560 [Siccirubricoccus deserti]